MHLDYRKGRQGSDRRGALCMSGLPSDTSRPCQLDWRPGLLSCGNLSDLFYDVHP